MVLVVVGSIPTNHPKGKGSEAVRLASRKRVYSKASKPETPKDPKPFLFNCPVV